MTFILRVKFGCDKYIGWAIFCFISVPTVEKELFNLFQTNVEEAIVTEPTTTSFSTYLIAFLLMAATAAVYEFSD